MKHAYDLSMKEANSVAAHVEPLKSVIATLAEEYEQKLVEVKQHGRDELTVMKQENKKLEQKLKQSRTKTLDHEHQIERLQAEIGELYKNYREEKSARRLLISDLSGRTANDLKPPANKDEPDPVQSLQYLDV